MKENWFKSGSIIWLWVGVMALAILTLAFQSGDGEVDPTHCSTCPPHTPTTTPTWTPTPVPSLQACQVTGIFFNDQKYTGTPFTAAIGVPLKVTLRVADAQGKPLIGANVDATVTQINDIQAAAIPPLEDQSGTYDGLYTPPNPGTYLLKFSVSDFTGPRFLPCSAEATVRVEDLPQCDLTVTPSPPPYFISQPLTLTTIVKVGGVNQCEATVNGTVTRPDNVIDTIPFQGSCPYLGFYTPTDGTGNYVFAASAEDSAQNPRFRPCTSTLTLPVSRTISPCQISLKPDKPEYTLGETIKLTATVTNTVCTNVNADIQIPGDGTITIPFTGTANICTGSYLPTVTGTYTITARSNSPGGMCGSNPITVPVVPTPPPTPTIQIELPPSPIDLCDHGPDISGTVAISNVTNLTRVQLEVDYAPNLIQVIDAIDRPQLPVQVKPDQNFDPFQRNEVDIQQGKIFFSANARTPITGYSNVIYIDWRLQGRTGTTPITVLATLTDAIGTRVVTQIVSPTIIIDSVCVQGIVNLQGRADHSGVKVSASSGQQAQSYPSGLFTIPSADPLSFVFPGYLAAQLNAPEGQAANQNNITLLAGDTNADNVINILDMTYLAGRYLSTDATGDLNGDGIVNILDLTLVAGNYQRRGPLTNWQ